MPGARTYVARYAHALRHYCMEPIDGTMVSPSTTESRYDHHEAIVISPLAPQVAAGKIPAIGSKKKLHIDVTHEAISSVALQPHAADTTGSGGPADLPVPATPFPSHIVELVRSHNLKRLLVQVGSSSSSSASTPTTSTSEGGSARRTAATADGTIGPVGTSITAEFYTAADYGESPSIDERVQSLLRSLVGSRLICAPLDSISIAKNQHHSYPYSYHNNNNNATATYQVVLPASAGHFCAEGLKSFRRNLLPCRDHAGLLAKAPTSDMLLGTAPAASSQSGIMRRSLWVDVSVNPSKHEQNEEGDGCFGRHVASEVDGVAHCTVSLKQGLKYGVEVDAIIKGSSSFPERYHYSSSISLGDVLGDTLSSLTHCPLADSSKVVTIFPNAVKRASFARPYQEVKVDSNSENDEDKELKAYELDLKVNGGVDNQVVHDIQSLIGQDGGPLLLDKEWASFELQVVTAPIGRLGRNILSVDRTVERPRGVANCGTFYSMYRNGASIDEKGGDVAVITMDTYPKFIRPLLQTLKVRLYEGNGAGDTDFVPAATSTFVDIQDYNVLPRNDGSLSLEVTKLLPPDSSLWISLEYKPRFLSFEHFPSDPNRGIDVLPSTGVFSLPNADVNAGVRLYSSSIIIMPPVPDMSMPFNVISLACTLYAFIIGSLINFLVRKGSQSISDAYKGRKPRNKLTKLKQKLRKKLQSFRKRKGERVREKDHRDLQEKDDDDAGGDGGGGEN